MAVVNPPQLRNAKLLLQPPQTSSLLVMLMTPEPLTEAQSAHPTSLPAHPHVHTRGLYTHHRTEDGRLGDKHGKMHESTIDFQYSSEA